MKKNALTKSSILHVAILTVSFIAFTLAVNPVGDFPINDDWSYGWTVSQLFQYGELKYTFFLAMPLITQALWGWLFSFFMDFSFTSLRMSTLALSLIGVLAFYILSFRCTNNKRLSLFGAFFLLLMPLYFNLSYTFMTDVPFTALALLSLIFLSEDLQSPKWSTFLLATIFLVATVLIRQLAIALPLGYLAALFVRDGIRWKSLLRGLIPLLACVGAYAIFSYWLASEHGLPQAYSFHAKKMLPPLDNPAPWVFGLVGMGIKFALIIGFFSLPMLGLYYKRIILNFYITFGRALSIALGLILIISYSLWDYFKDKPPILDSTLKDFGLGEVLLRDIYFLDLPHWPSAPDFVWQIAMFLSLTGFILLCMLIATELLKIFRKTPSRISKKHLPTITLYIATAFVYMGPLTAAGPGGFDRYMILPIALLGLSTLATLSSRETMYQASSPGAMTTNPAWLPGGILLFLFGAFSILATHDYMNFQRARWSAIEHLTSKEKVPYTEIDAGLEFNCLAWANHTTPVDKLITPPPIPEGKSWWCVVDDKYLVTLGPVSGYREVTSYTFDRWLPGQKGKILVLVRDEVAQRNG